MLSKIEAGGSAASPPALALDARGGAVVVLARRGAAPVRPVRRRRPASSRYETEAIDERHAHRQGVGDRQPAADQRGRRRAARSRASSRRCSSTTTITSRPGRSWRSSTSRSSRTSASTRAPRSRRPMRGCSRPRRSVKEAKPTCRACARSRSCPAARCRRRPRLETAEATVARADADEASAARRGRAGAGVAEFGGDEPGEGVDPLARSTASCSRAQIEPGQTVAASFQAPTLFTLAEDLAAMELRSGRGRGRRGPGAGRPGGHVHGGRLPGPSVPGPHHGASGYGSQTKDGVVTYKTVLERRQRRPDAAAGHDGHGRHHDRSSAERRCSCRTPRCGSRRRRPRRRRRNGRRAGHRLEPAAAPAGTTGQKPTDGGRGEGRQRAGLGPAGREAGGGRRSTVGATDGTPDRGAGRRA